MLILRNEQMRAFDADRRRRFEQQMFEHARRYFPERCRMLGDEQTREWILHGIDRSGSYGIVSDRDVCKYIDVMFVYGREFDVDPQCRWAPKILGPQHTDPARKAALLLEAAKRHEKEKPLDG